MVGLHSKQARWSLTPLLLQRGYLPGPGQCVFVSARVTLTRRSLVPSPQVHTYVRAHDVSNGITLEQAGAKAVVPETLEPSLQLAAAVLSEMDFSDDEVGPRSERISLYCNS